MPQAIPLWRGREKMLPDRFLKLGAWGTAVNATAIVWVIFLDGLACFPAIRPATAENMNYMSVVGASLICMVLAFWFVTKRGKFKGPTVNPAVIDARRQAALYRDALAIETHEVEVQEKESNRHLESK